MALKHVYGAVGAGRDNNPEKPGMSVLVQRQRRTCRAGMLYGLWTGV